MEEVADSSVTEFAEPRPEEQQRQEEDSFLAEFSNWVTTEEEQEHYNKSFLVKYINLLPDELRWRIIKIQFDWKCFTPIRLYLGPSWLTVCSRRQRNNYLRRYYGRLPARRRIG